MHLVHRACLVALTIGAADGVDLNALLAPIRDALVHDLARFWVRRVIQALHLDPVARILHSAGVVDDAPRDERLVEHGQLHQHAWGLRAPLPPLRVLERRVRLRVQQRPQLEESGDLWGGRLRVSMRERVARIRINERA